jgi:small subunit ribosomal protein S17
MAKRVMQGTVVSDKMDKTVVVQIERKVRHPLYDKIVRRTKKYLAHDESGQCRLGDVVRIEECPPMSRRKRWTIISGADVGEGQNG